MKIIHFFPKKTYLSVIFASCISAVYANPYSFLQESKVDGNLRLYNFTREFGNPNLPTQNSFSLGGRVNFLTGPVYNFKAGLSFYAADSLGLNSDDFAHIDPTLPGRTVNVLGQSFLEYENKYFLLRGGNQLMTTPWLNPADGRMIPAAYQGLFTTIKPFENFDIHALRVFAFKSRTSSVFNHTNTYTPENFATPILPLEHVDVIGALAGGADYRWLYQSHEIKTQAWYYKFYDFAKLFYIDSMYHFHNECHIEPFVGLQGGAEGGDGKNYLEEFGLGETDSIFYGATTGIDFDRGQISLGYDNIPVHRGAFKGGDIVSPYTSGYVFDPLYTTSMVQGLVEKASGYAYKVGGNVLFADKQLKLALSYAKYFTEPTQNNTNEVDFDIKLHD